MTDGIDFAGISSAALSNARLLLPKLIPGGSFGGREYVVRNPRREDQHPGSFKINFKTGVWKDFATGDGGADLISLAAHVWGCSQGDAARRLADVLGVPAVRHNGATRSKTNGSGNGAAHNAPHVYQWGDEGPPIFADEIRRHVYRRRDIPVQIKIKKKHETWTSWFRLFRNDTPIGWQAQKPIGFRALPYIGADLDPFDPELKDDYIFWTEGEKDVDTLSRKNLLAFTFGGTGDGLPHDIAHFLKDRHLAIPADNDDLGRAHAEKKASVAFAAGAASIKIVHFPELAQKGDVSDFIELGGTAEELVALVGVAEVWSPPQDTSRGETTEKARSEEALISRLAAEILPEKIEWLWPGRLAIGKHTCVAGEPGAGKSQLTIAIVAALTNGGLWPCGEGRARAGNIIILSAEDGAADTIIPRLLAAGADLKRVHVVSAVRNADGSRRALKSATRFEAPRNQDHGNRRRHFSSCRSGVLLSGKNRQSQE